MDTMPDTIAPPPAGHNNPPLEALLDQETHLLRLRIDDLVAQSTRCKVADEFSAGQAAALFVAMREIAGDDGTIAELRKTISEPHQSALDVIRAYFRALRDQLATWDGDVMVAGPMYEVNAQVEAYQADLVQRQTEERRRLDLEAQQQRKTAAEAARDFQASARKYGAELAEAERKVNEATDRVLNATSADEQLKAERALKVARAELRRLSEEAAKETLEAQIAADRAQTKADQALVKAAKPVRTTIRSAYGASAGRRKVSFVTLSDDPAELRKAVAYAYRLDPETILAAVQEIYEKQAKAGNKDLPGARVIKTAKTVMRKG